MVEQYLKNLYYSSVGKVSILSLCRHRFFFPKRFYDAFLHIGCGTKYLEGMINVDGNIFRKKDMWLDVTLGLPFKNNSIKGIYTNNVLEHFNVKNVKKLLREFYRALKPSGVIRIAVPSLEYAIKAYSEGRSQDLSGFPEKFDSVGGRFNSFMLCANQHFVMFDFSFLNELLKEAGFAFIVREKPGESKNFKKEHLQYEPKDAGMSGEGRILYVESCK